MAAQFAVDFVQKELQKMQALQQEGFMTPESYEHKARFLRQEGAVAEAGVGITIADVYPFRVTDMREGGPAQKTAVIRVGDDLQKVDGKTRKRMISAGARMFTIDYVNHSGRRGTGSNDNLRGEQ